MAEADQARELERVLVRECGRRFIADCLEAMPHRLPRELAEYLAELGYQFSDDAIRTWRDGRYPVPSDVLIALARSLRKSVDEHVFARAALAQDVRLLQQRQAELELLVRGAAQQSELEALRADLQRLASRLGDVADEVEPAPVSRRAAGGRSSSR